MTARWPAIPVPSVAWVATMMCVAVVVMFGTTFVGLQQLWERDANYTHGYLVVPVAMLFAYFGLRDAGWPVTGETRLGCFYLLGGISLHPIATLYWSLILDFIALVFILRGLALLAGGRTWAQHFTFSIAFLFFMFPLPRLWGEFIALWLQDIVAALSAWALDVCFICYQRGTILYVAGVRAPLVVAEECSGLRQLGAFLALGAVVGHWARRPFWLRLVLLLAALPIAVFANVLRVLMMAFGARYFGIEWLSGWLHHAPILFALPVGIALFYMIDRGVGSWPARPQEAS
jgi:exosortase